MDELKETLASIHDFVKSKNVDVYFFHIWMGEEFGGGYTESFTVRDAVQSIYTTIQIFELQPRDVLDYEQVCRLQDRTN